MSVRYAIRVAPAEPADGPCFAVTSDREPVVRVAYSLPAAHDVVARLEAVRLAGHAWRVREVATGEVHARKLLLGVGSGAVIVFRAVPDGPSAWSQAARFMAAWRSDGRRAPKVA